MGNIFVDIKEAETEETSYVIIWSVQLSRMLHCHLYFTLFSTRILRKVYDAYP